MASSLKFGSESSAVVDRYQAQMRAGQDKYGEYDITYAHASMCQVYLPYQDLDCNLYEVSQGNLTMRVQGASYFEDGDRNKPVNRGVPYGTRARLLLYLINEQAILNQSPSFHLADSFSDLCRKLHIPASGRSMGEIKIQLERLCTSSFSLEWKNTQTKGMYNFFIVKSIVTNGRSKNMDYSDVVKGKKGFHVTLSEEYWESVKRQGVPLDRRTITALQNNSMCLDIYNWLTHRLYRIPKDSNQFITWKAIKDQFGHGYAKMDSFKRDFRKNLKNVTLQYRAAKISEVYNKGFQLYPSAPPIGELMPF